MKKKLFSIVLSLCMVLAFMPQMVFAAGAGGAYTVITGTAGAGDKEQPAALFDGKTHTKWCVTDFKEAYIIFKTDSAVNVSGYSITTGNDNSKYPGRNPKTWTLYGCNATNDPARDSESWTAIHSVTNDIVLRDNDVTKYNFGFDKKGTEYQYYKLEITAIQSGDVMQMGEFALTSCDHKWDTSVSVDHTCANAGYTKKVCTLCNAISISNYIAPLGHDFSGEEGKCTNCNKTKAEVYTFDISNGTIRIVDSDNTNGKIKVFYGDVQFEDNIDPNEIITVIGNTTNYELRIDTDKPVTIRANDLNIDRSDRDETHAMLIEGGATSGQQSADVTLILEGSSTFKGGIDVAGITVGPGRKLTIEGSGTVTAIGRSRAAGIGGDYTSSCGTVIIKSGTINATAGNNSYYAPGIGSGGYRIDYGNGGTIIITGGTIKTNSKRDGIGRKSDDDFNGDTFKTQGGNAVIFAKSIPDQSDKTNWSGIIFEENSGKVYGASVTPTDDFTIESSKTLTIESGKSLTIPEGVTMTNEGTINNSGKIYVDGTLNGTVGGNVYYRLTVSGGTATGSTGLVTYDGKIYATVGSSINLTPDTPQAGYAFDRWEASPTSVTIGNDNKFIMPNKAITVAAKYKDIEAPVISGVKDGETYCSAETVTVSDNDAIKTITVNGTEVNLVANKQFTLPANGEQTIVATDNAGNETSVTVTVNNGHTFGAWQSNGEGTHIRYCTVDGCDGYEDGKCTGGEATCTSKATCEYCSKKYDELDSSNHSLENIHAKDATVTETGNKEYCQCENCKKIFADENGTDEITLDDTITQKLPPEIIKGMDQSVTEGEKKALSFTSNAAYSDFIRVELDGSELSEENYEKAEGSIIITLDADYVATLPAGEHTIGIVSESGTAETTFTVEEKAAPGTIADSDKDSKSDNEDSAKTGDNANLALWLALMLLSVAGITGTNLYTRRKRTNE